MNKAQQMRWNRATVQPFLDVRTAVLNDTLEDAFRQRYPGFRPTNDDQALPEAACSPHDFACSPTVLIQRSNNRRTKSRLRGRLESREETPVVDTTDSRHGTAEILNAALMSANLCHVLSRRPKHPVDACATDAEP